MRPSVVFLCRQKSQHGLMMLRALCQNGYVPDMVLMEVPLSVSVRQEGIKDKLSRLFYAEGWSGVIREILRKLKSPWNPFLDERCLADDDIELFVRTIPVKVLTVHDHNAPESQNILAKLNPDLLILGGTRIIRKNILDIPHIGTLNIHPGHLPDFRGVDVIPWAILKGRQPYITVHFVDIGVDTGDIIMRRPLPLEDRDTLDYLEIKAMRIGAEMLIETLDQISQGREERIPQLPTAGVQYFRMSYQNRKRVRKQLFRMVRSGAC